jgi:hypothetical protein
VEWSRYSKQRRFPDDRETSTRDFWPRRRSQAGWRTQSNMAAMTIDYKVDCVAALKN